MPPKFRVRAEDCFGYTCSYPRCNACIRKDGAPDCEGSGCAEPRCRTCEGTETDREEEKRYHKAQEFLMPRPFVDYESPLYRAPHFAFPNPPIPDHGKVNGGQPSVSRPETPQAWADNWPPDLDERYKCKTCKNWERYWKRASTLSDDERRQQDETKLHYFFGKSGTYCTCAPEDMAQRAVREYHLDWEPKDKNGKAINFRTFGPQHMPAEVLVDEVRSSKRIERSIRSEIARNKRRSEEMDRILDAQIQRTKSQNAVTKGHNNIRGVEKSHSSMLVWPFAHSAQPGHTTKPSSARPSGSAATTAPSEPASLVAEASSGTSELSRKRRHTETIESEGDDRVLLSLEDQNQSILLDDFDFDLHLSDVLARNDMDLSCDRREVRLKRIVTLMRRRLVEIVERDLERRERVLECRKRNLERRKNLNHEVNEILQGCTCKARRL